MDLTCYEEAVEVAYNCPHKIIIHIEGITKI